MTERIDVCGTAEVSEGQAIKVEAGGLTLAVYNVGGSFYVTDDHCTHGPGSLSQGMLDGYEIECDFHQGCFVSSSTAAGTARTAAFQVRRL